MPNRRHSMRIASVNPVTANLLAEYSERPGRARRALTEPMVTITGSRPAARRGNDSRQTSAMAKTLISKTRRSTEASCVSNCPVAPTPALLTTRSSAPKRSRARVKRRRRSSSIVRSAATVIIRAGSAPSRVRPPTTAARRSVDRPVSNTVAPARTRRAARAWPSPDDAPVTRPRVSLQVRRAIPTAHLSGRTVAVLQTTRPAHDALLWVGISRDGYCAASDRAQRTNQSLFDRGALVGALYLGDCRRRFRIGWFPAEPRLTAARRCAHHHARVLSVADGGRAK